jgi:nitronate monooxygenase
VPLPTAVTSLLGVSHPILLAPMGGAAGGALAAAVSAGGGFGLVGGGRESGEWAARELEIVRTSTQAPWGIGFLTFATDASTVERALKFGPTAVMLSFGDPRPLAPVVRDSPAHLIVQVTDLDEARAALAVGADLIVAQGTESGGHGGTRGTLPFVPAVIDLVTPTPVLAAGGVGDGRGLAAALALGAAGVLIGTRFLACLESLAQPAVVKAILEGGAEDTERNRVLDIARRAPWPSRYTARTMRNAFTDHWRGREEELAQSPAVLDGFAEAAERGDMDVVPVWAGESMDLFDQLESATDVVGAIARQAEEALDCIDRRSPGPSGVKG